MSTIPLFKVEEHNEVLYVWNIAHRKGLVQPSGNELLHVDEHADNLAPSCNVSVPALEDGLDEVYQFVSNEVTIASFLIPALYQGLFDTVCWAKRGPGTVSRKSYSRFVYSYGGDGRRLFFEAKRPNIRVAESKEIRVHLRDTADLPQMRNCVLDIDLDCFSTIDAPSLRGPLEVEITKREFDSFNCDLQHPLRLRLLRNRVDSAELAGRYYYIIDGYKFHYDIDHTRVNSREGIESSIATFCEQLSMKDIQPQIIDICRSRSSGYTPTEQCEFIEETLLGELRRLYPLEEVEMSGGSMYSGISRTVN